MLLLHQKRHRKREVNGKYRLEEKRSGAERKGKAKIAQPLNLTFRNEDLGVNWGKVVDEERRITKKFMRRELKAASQVATKGGKIRNRRYGYPRVKASI